MISVYEKLATPENQQCNNEVLSSAKSDDYFKYLVNELDALVDKIAHEFNLYYKEYPRKASILDALLRYRCPGCVVKALTQQSTKEIDAIYIENHRLAVNMLLEQLKAKIRAEGLCGTVEAEVTGNYAKTDILIKLEKPDRHIVIEVKCGKSFDYPQILRYFLQDRRIALVAVWRVSLHQLILISRSEIKALLTLATEAAINEAKTVLKRNENTCNHKMSEPKDITATPQELVNSTLRGIADIKTVIDAMINSLRSTPETR
ncbi:MAG: hypothetical protein QXZ70_03425 [Candidatus Bathyarchaeia archaeon]